MGKNLRTNGRDSGSTLGSEDLLQKEMATHSNILSREIPWAEEPSGHNYRMTTTATTITCIPTDTNFLKYKPGIIDFVEKEK